MTTRWERTGFNKYEMGADCVYFVFVFFKKVNFFIIFKK